MSYPKRYREYIFSFKGLLPRSLRNPSGFLFTLVLVAVIARAFFKEFRGFEGVSLDQFMVIAIGLVPAIVFVIAWPRSTIAFDEKGFELKRGLRKHSARWEEVRHIPFLMSVGSQRSGTRPTSYIYFVTNEKKGPYIDTSRLIDVASGELVDGDAFIEEVKGLCPNLEPVYRSFGQNQATRE